MSRRPLKQDAPSVIATEGSQSHPKQPRQFAQECLALTESERVDFLLTVPIDIFNLVEFYVNDHERKLAALVACIIKQPTRELRVKVLERTPSKVREEVSRRVVAHYEQKRAQKK